VEQDAARPQRRPCISVRIPIQIAPKEHISIDHLSISRPALGGVELPSSSAGMGWMANLDLGYETAIGGDTIPAVLDIMQGVFPRDLEVLHDEHDHEGWRGRDSA